MKTKEINKRVLVAAFLAAILFVVCAFPVLASSTDVATSAINEGFQQLVDIVAMIISCIGALFLMWGFLEWGTSLQSGGDGGSMQSIAFKKIAGGIVVCLAPQIIKAFAFVSLKPNI